MSTLLRGGYEMLRGKQQKQTTRRMTILGMWASGKTTMLACLGLTCESLSARDKNFRFWPDEQGSGIRSFWSGLRQGNFPPSTVRGTYYESALHLSWKDGFMGSWETIEFPCCETAGEDIADLVATFSKNPYTAKRTITDPAKRQLFEYILRSDAFILTVATPRTGIGQGMESEPEGLPDDPDLNLARLMDAVHRYREQTLHKPVKGVAIVLTKYDMVTLNSQLAGMDLYTQEGLERFLVTFMPQTIANVKAFQWPVKYFPMYVRTVDDKGTQVLVNQQTRMPVYAEQKTLELIQFARETIAH